MHVIKKILMFFLLIIDIRFRYISFNIFCATYFFPYRFNHWSKSFITQSMKTSSLFWIQNQTVIDPDLMVPSLINDHYDFYFYVNSFLCMYF